MTAIFVRLGFGPLEQIKLAANRPDLPYHALFKPWLADKVAN